MAKKILFIVKRRQGSGSMDFQNSSISTGLKNSVQFVVDMLKDNGIKAKIVLVTDNNCIDKEVDAFKPDIVMIEALWVVPEKFEILQKLHPTVKWIVRLHSEMPFISQEGNAIKWIFEYLLYKNVYVAANSPKMYKDLMRIFPCELPEPLLLPNYYPLSDAFPEHGEYDGDILEIGCFGAIRPLKNQLQQAVAALDYAEKKKKYLHFNINAGRIESGGQPILKNLEALFDVVDARGTLIKWGWMDHKTFLAVLAYMDVNMQVSFSETFNVVSADSIGVGVPIVVSDEIFWARCFANPTDTKDIVKKLDYALRCPGHNVRTNFKNLQKYLQWSKNLWLKLF